MKTRFILSFLLILLTLTVVSAEEQPVRNKDEAKALSGMSIVGNDQSPKALYIVPWKSSDVGVETVLNMPANSGYTPVDRDEFRRKLDYYYFRTTSKTGR